MPGSREARLRALGLSLPQAHAPLANYVPVVAAGGLLFISGQVPRRADGSVVPGRVGDGANVADGQAAARLAGLAILAQAQAALGTLDRIERVVRLNGAVNATPEFADHPLVINGASDLMVEVLGEAGRHSRTAIGVASLPGGAIVEIDAVLAVTA
jgi:enamine deaminase RidA (YjgF/YER057c/UK114 family)